MRRRRIPFWLWSLCWALCLVASDAHANLAASLDRDRIAAGETVQLTLEADGQVSGRPDTQPLEKDFDILGVASGSRINIVNGHMDARTSWEITLAPRHGGRLLIPPLEVDGESSPPLTLEVSAAPVASDAGSGNPVFIETEVDPRSPYVEGMVRYTVRLFYRVPLSKGTLSDVAADNAVVRQIGKDHEYRADRGGWNYHVIERRYAIFPQSSGKLVLSAPVLDARVPDNSARGRDPFTQFFGSDPFSSPVFGGNPLRGMLGATRPLRVRGNAETLQVRPRPASSAKQGADVWLPAEDVTLSEQWQPASGDLHVGDPLSRTITITARGLTGEQLPDLAAGVVDGFKAYPDRAQAQTRDLDRDVEGTKTRNIAYVPLEAGRYLLPPIRLHWWNTRTDHEEVAEVSAHTVVVAPTPGSQGTAGPTPQAMRSGSSDQESSLSSEAAVSGPLAPSGRASGGRPVPGGIGIWPGVSLLFAVLWLSTIAAWWYGRRRKGHEVTGAPAREDAAREHASHARAGFRSACRANDPRAARRCLLEWAASHWRDEPPVGLDGLARRLGDPRITAALSDLDRALYRSTTMQWDGAALAAVLKDLPAPPREKQGREPLPDLYA